MKSLAFLFIIISFISCAPATTQRQHAIPRTTSTKGTYYFVKKGDSLWAISKKYSVSIKEIMQENRISSPRNLKVGQKIFIPYHRRNSGKYFTWPVQGEIINFFNENVDNSLNRGVNIKTNFKKNQVSAAAGGKVVFSDDLKGWGKTIILKHDSSLYTIYANLAETKISEGAYAKKGQGIGEIASGKNGNYILHFEVRKKYIPQDPLRYLN
jgi:lipoprotein NlpD